jgi:hypothetical protein
MAAISLLSAAAFGLRLIGNLIRQSAMVLLHLYDMLIFAPLALSARLARRRQRLAARPQAADTETSSTVEHSAPEKHADHRGGVMDDYHYGSTPA